MLRALTHGPRYREDQNNASRGEPSHWACWRPALECAPMQNEFRSHDPLPWSHVVLFLESRKKQCRVNYSGLRGIGWASTFLGRAFFHPATPKITGGEGFQDLCRDSWGGTRLPGFFEKISNMTISRPLSGARHKTEYSLNKNFWAMGWRQD